MIEEWRNIEGFEGFYQVSNYGNVRSLNYANLGYTKLLYLKNHNKGYLQVELVKNGKRKMCLVHRLVATSFLQNTSSLPFVNHKDENRKNNHVDNLEWCNQKYNASYSLNLHSNRLINRKPTEKYAQNTNLKINQFSKDGTFIKQWCNSRAIFVETGMSDWSISECCRGNRKTAYKYMWKYAT